MPTVLRIDGYRFYFYPHDLFHEPPHIHVRKAGNEAKFWLNPVRLVRNKGYRYHELNTIQRLVEKNEILLMQRWNEDQQML